MKNKDVKLSLDLNKTKPRIEVVLMYRDPGTTKTFRKHCLISWKPTTKAKSLNNIFKTIKFDKSVIELIKLIKLNKTESEIIERLIENIREKLLKLTTVEKRKRVSVSSTEKYNISAKRFEILNKLHTYVITGDLELEKNK